MATLKVLYVTGGPAALDLIREISWNKKRGTFVGTGDAAVAVHAGRAAPATGTVLLEDATSAAAIVAAAVTASVVLTCQGDTGVVNVTCTNFLATGYQTRVGDGSKDQEPVVGFDVSFVAASIAVAAAA
jgi:hypothetical protein